jgi:glycosyltransferase involved in cell wall biosynthesis
VRVLVAPLNARIGGTQINAVDLGAAVRDLGHEVIVYAEEGPLDELIAGRGLPKVVAATPAQRVRGTRAARELHAAVVRERIDLVHAYERARAVQAYVGAFLRTGTPVVATIYSMSVPRDLPRDLPIVVGTRELLASARERDMDAVDLLEPPVDTRSDHPGVSGSAFRLDLGIGADELAVVVVSRLSEVLKLQGLLGAIDAVEVLATEFPVRLVIVGDGPARDRVGERAESANERTGRTVAMMTGFMQDPRPAYAAADVVLGMGSSALRGMALGKPLVVLGEGGFSEVFDPTSAPRFFEIGMYGFADEAEPDRLAGQLRRLLGDAELRGELGRYSRSVAEERYGLEAAASALDGIYRRVAARRAGLLARIAHGARAGARLLRSRATRRTAPAPGRAGRKPSEW